MRFYTSDVNTMTEMVQKAVQIARHDGIGRNGQRVVITSRRAFPHPGNTNILRIAWIEDENGPTSQMSLL